VSASRGSLADTTILPDISKGKGVTSVEGSASFRRIEEELAGHYQPSSGDPQAIRRYTIALVWCRQRLRHHQDRVHDADALITLVLRDWLSMHIDDQEERMFYLERLSRSPQLVSI
jgi:hypothetical protein